jgi:hypothetical protein
MAYVSALELVFVVLMAALEKSSLTSVLAKLFICKEMLLENVRTNARTVNGNGRMIEKKGRTGSTVVR